jgi:hypothetical protein
MVSWKINCFVGIRRFVGKYIRPFNQKSNTRITKSMKSGTLSTITFS